MVIHTRRSGAAIPEIKPAKPSGKKSVKQLFPCWAGPPRRWQEQTGKVQGGADQGTEDALRCPRVPDSFHGRPALPLDQRAVGRQAETARSTAARFLVRPSRRTRGRLSLVSGTPPTTRRMTSATSASSSWGATRRSWLTTRGTVSTCADRRPLVLRQVGPKITSGAGQWTARRAAEYLEFGPGKHRM